MQFKKLFKAVSCQTLENILTLKNVSLLCLFIKINILQLPEDYGAKYEIKVFQVFVILFKNTQLNREKFSISKFDFFLIIY